MGWRTRRLVPAAIALVSLLPVGSAGARAGDLDRGFARTGSTTIDFGGSDQPTAMAVQGDGKVLVAGVTSGRYKGFYDFAVARITTKGKRDRSFSKDGKLTTDFGGAADIATGVAAAPGGKTVVAGLSIPDLGTTACCTSRLALARYTRKGSLDKTFGDGGRVIVDVPGATPGDGFWNGVVAVQPDGAVVVGTTLTTSVVVPTQDQLTQHATQMAVLRFDAAGQPDPTFGVAGRVLLRADTATDTLVDVGIAKDGSIYVAGTTAAASNPGFILIHLSTAGVPDVTFGRGGTIVTGFPGGRAIAAGLAFDGNTVVVAGTLDGPVNGLAAARYHLDGTMDTSFDKDGVALRFYGDDLRVFGVTVASGHRIVAAGYMQRCAYYCTTAAALWRLTKKGSIDKRFGYGGVADGPSEMIYPSAVELQRGKPVMVGLSTSIRVPRSGLSIAGFDFGIARVRS